ncbi:hypothetical protein Emtol_0230 (plasmid) [Emticicia oligotrophica DSM 17448]|uniref:Nucleic acid binding protein n=1 Tax=Emticicia oligotrophica (strain DSM 17448 / CIP 109782 / MTCC 6937 / GPTSA100-15) TaxID=929562 RepID=A0ABM5N7V4_EMTOG|nr:hypothetical protein [Emticicia oligotrophica]AFK05501.1 hypothetical protein Emtol_0230 [Emticicia oligotrophica DSM 17448]
MMKNKFFKVGVWLALVGVTVAVGVGLYMFNMPHRDVVAQKADYSFQASDIVNEYLADAAKANQKYLDAEGESKILSIRGNVAKIEEDLEGNKVVLLKNEGEKAGVSCTFTKETNAKANSLKVGETTTIKGVIRSGATFDKDLDMYENVVVEKCDIVLE